MAVLLSDLLQTPTEDSLRQQILSDLNAAGFPITDWQSGAVLKTYVYMLARIYSILLGQLIPKIAGGGFLSTADEDWITLLAKEVYNVDRQDATFTIQRSTLTCAAGSGPYTISIGAMIAQTTAGRRYRNITGGSLSTAAPLELQWQSEGPFDSTNPATSYLDQAGSMTTLLTPLPGVTINNPIVDFTPVTLGANPSSLMTATRTIPITAPTAGTLLVKISTPGQVGTATFVYRRIGIDSGFTTTPITVGTFAVPTIGVTLGFVNDPNSAVTFLAGGIFSVSAPGGPILSQGRDRETAPALVARCMDRFPALSDIPTESRYRLWAFAASVEVTKVGISTDPIVANQVNVTIGTQLNPASGAVVAAVQQYMDLRTGSTEAAVVTTATSRAVTIKGSVTVPVGTSAEAKVAADAAWSAYIGAQDLGGTARLAALQKILGDAGATDLTGVGFGFPNVAAPPSIVPPVNLKAAANEQLVIVDVSALPSAALTWYEAAL